jgi:hypothetical protein
MNTSSSTTTGPAPSDHPLERLLRGSDPADDDDHQPPRRISSLLRWIVVLVLAVLFAYGEITRAVEPKSPIIVGGLTTVLLVLAAFVESRTIRFAASGALIAVSMAHIHYGAAPLPGLAAVILSIFVLVLAATKTDAELC